MPARLSWRHVIPGLIALAIMAGTVVAVMMFSGVGTIRGDTQKLFIATGHARGLINGSEVWLAGQKIGIVEEMGFMPLTADSSSRLLVIATVMQDAANQIRRDSKVMIRSGGTVVGPIVVWIEPGTPASPAVTERDTLRAVMASELEIAGSKAARATEHLPALIADARGVLAQVRDPNGVRAAFSGDAMAEAKQLMATLDRAQRSGAAKQRGTLMASAGSALARVDSIRALLATPTGNVGRFRRDTTLRQKIGDVRDELAALQARMDSTTGTLDRLGSDSVLTRAVADARLEMTLLFADLKKRPLRYIAF